MRIAILLLSIGLVGSMSAYAAVDVQGPPRTETQKIALKNSAGVDPIITGRTVTMAHYNRWLDARKQFEECPTCVAEQPYPGDNSQE